MNQPPSVAVVCLHTSPLAQPGTGDGGGMNVYVKELSTALARAGVTCDVYTRATDPTLPATVSVEPGFRVHNVPAGPLGAVAKEDLPGLLPTFTAAVRERFIAQKPDIIHANYWLSGAVGHVLKHEFDVPLVTTFHTLARVKTASNDPEPEARAGAEESIIGCSDAVLASCSIEADQLVTLYDADRARIEEVPLGVDRAYFSPGSSAGARSAVGFPDVPTVLFVGRIQPLKGADLAVEAFARADHPTARLVIVGGPSGRHGTEEVDRVHDLVRARGLSRRVQFVDPQPHHLLSTYYRAADVVLVPSRSESFGLVALEAAACGTAVIASRVGGLQTIIDDDITGVLVDGRDPDIWADQLCRLLAHPSEAGLMGEAAALRSRRYAWSVTAGRLRRLFGDLRARESVLACV